VPYKFYYYYYYYSYTVDKHASETVKPSMIETIRQTQKQEQEQAQAQSTLTTTCTQNVPQTVRWVSSIGKTFSIS